ncbi:RES domain-containing protein [Spiribacter sp. C176]|uniref:RES domain-containing protein n=1 Tax=Spiribacter salilacus TaxID=2664894 RepID=A0A6N7QRH1_9GAMM|nr:RES domain-containing protein [Spiribacter salilacus]
MIDINTLPGSEVDQSVYRIILARYPQIDLFDRVSNPQDWEVLYAVESLTNPRLRDAAGDIRLVPAEDRVYGDGASWIMAAFTHPPVDGRGSRFNRDFGVYYCAADENVAIAESSFHRGRFLRESRIEETTQEMRVIRAHLGPVTLHDVRHLSGHAIYHPDDYGAAQELGYALREAKSFGVHYHSVRADGECYGVMRPRALSNAIHWRYLRYQYAQGSILEVE